jgi:FAD/FMN-containing dehydrogenase
MTLHPVQAEELLAKLARLLAPNPVVTDEGERERYAVDALGWQRGFADEAAPPVVPIAVVRPRSTDDVSALLRFAHEERVPVVPYGGGSGLMGGARVIEPAIVLDMREMRAVREIDVESQRVLVEAGATLAEVDGAVAPHGLVVRHDPWTFGVATVGGTISTNGLGFLGAKYGSMGAQVLGLEVVLAGGEVLRTPGVSPRSTGINLDRLFSAAEGTLGVITAAWLRVWPAPEAQRLSGWRFASFADGFGAIMAMQRAGFRPAVLDFGDAPDEDGEATLYLGFEGMREEADAVASRAARICGDAGGTAVAQDEVDAWWARRHAPAENFARRRAAGITARPPAEGGTLFDYMHVSLPPSRVLAYRDDALRAAAEEGVRVVETGLWVAPGMFSMVFVADAVARGEGVARMSAAVDACARLAVAVGGSMEYCHGAGVRLAHLMREEHGDAGMEALRAVKRALDPHNVLNPGKLGLDA